MRMIHVAILLKPYLDLVLAGKKTVECRLTRQACAPYEAIEAGERIYFKQSSGPYGATAIAEQVLFRDTLTRSAVRELWRAYNHLICGEAEYWRLKQASRFCTLIWLSDVTATDSGPEIPNPQGRAWLTLEEDPAWRRVGHPRNIKKKNEGGAFSIAITAGNIRNNSLYVTNVLERFPAWAVGGKDKTKAAKAMTLILHEGPTVRTDIVGPRNLLRTRVWGKWFREHEAKPTDRVVFEPVEEGTYLVGLMRGS
ncbi:MAG TPA: ASCH domain-containing protein [Phycisphaerales bacterium]|nr:ASCH domain-containing protein [Phycisphaerales bacterium]